MYLIIYVYIFYNNLTIHAQDSPLFRKTRVSYKIIETCKRSVFMTIKMLRILIVIKTQFLGMLQIQNLSY